MNSHDSDALTTMPHTYTVLPIHHDKQQYITTNIISVLNSIVL